MALTITHPTVVGPDNPAYQVSKNVYETSHTIAGTLPVTNGGTSATTAGAAATNLGLGTGDSPQFTAVNIGDASDTTLARASAGNLAVEGNALYRAGGTDVPVADGGTGASTASVAATNLGLGTGDSPQFTAVNIGDATDTTLGRTSAGLLNVEGVDIVTVSATQTLTSKTLTSAKITTGVEPTTNDGAALGTTSKQFSDVFLATGGVVNWDNGSTTITGYSSTLSFSNDAGTFSIHAFGVDGVVRATLGGAWKSRATDLSIAHQSTTDGGNQAIHLAANSQGTYGLVFSRTMHDNPYIHSAITASNVSCLTLESLGSHENSWDGMGRLRCTTDGVPGPIATTPGGRGLASKWIFDLTPVGQEGFSERFSLYADGTTKIRTEYANSLVAPDFIVYMLDFEWLTVFGDAPSAGMGIGQRYSIDTAQFSGNSLTVAATEVVLTDVTAASEDVDYVIKLMAGGAAMAEKFRVTSGGAVEMTEMTAPAAPAANKARLFIQDNGGGKTQLAVRFPSGAVQVIVTEP